MSVSSGQTADRATALARRSFTSGEATCTRTPTTHSLVGSFRYVFIALSKWGFQGLPIEFIKRYLIAHRLLSSPSRRPPTWDRRPCDLLVATPGGHDWSCEVFTSHMTNRHS